MNFQIQIDWRQERHRIGGNYLQAGQGSQQSRTAFQISTEMGQFSIVKITDGRFFYTQTYGPDDHQLDFVDLSQIEESRTRHDLTEPNNPMNWTSAGGFPSLLKNASDAFEFGPPEISSASNGQRSTTVRGTWNPVHLAELIRQIDPGFDSTSIPWEQTPAQIPHAIQIRFEDNHALGPFPREIVFLRYQTNHGTDTHAVPMATIDFEDPQPVFAADIELLKLKSEDVAALDSTAQYTDQFEDFKYQRQAQLQTESTVNSTNRQ